MNAGRDVERLIADWLVEEAPARAPDRILGAAGRQIDGTKQRWLAAAWREPMIITTGRLLVAAAIVIAAVFGAGLVGRVSAPSVAGPAPTDVPARSATPSVPPSPSVSPSPSQPTIESFRTARNAICVAARASTLTAQLDGVYDPGLSKAERAAKIAVLQQIVEFGKNLRTQLAALPVPPEMAADQAAFLTRGEDNQAILEQEVTLLKAGKLSEAKQVDLLTDPINRMAEQFEAKWHLEPCP